MNNISTHNILGFGIIYGVSIFSISAIALILLIAYFCNRRRTLSPPLPVESSVHGGSDDEEDSISIEIGLKESTLKTYPKIIYRQLKHERGDSSVASSCSICLGEYSDNDILLLLPDCDHLFHFQCIDPWLKLHTTCPICRNSPVITTKTVLNNVTAEDQVAPTTSTLSPFGSWFVPFTH